MPADRYSTRVRSLRFGKKRSSCFAFLFLDFILPKAEAWRQDAAASTRSPLLAAAVAVAILGSAAVAAAGVLTFAVFVVVMITLDLGVEA